MTWPIGLYHRSRSSRLRSGRCRYVVWRSRPARRAGGRPRVRHRILELLTREGLQLAAILNTHGHVDHIAGNAAMKDAFPDAPLIIGRNEVHLLADADANLSAPFGMPLTSPPADRLVADGERLELAGFSFEVREIPGHSPGSVVFVCDAVRPAVRARRRRAVRRLGRPDRPRAGTARNCSRGFARSSSTSPTGRSSFPATAR